MQKRAAGACCTIDDLFRQDLKVLTIVGVFITQDADRAEPAMADTNDLIAFAQGANGDRANCRIEPRHIPAAGENTDHAFPGAHATPLSFSIPGMIVWRNSLCIRQPRLKSQLRKGAWLPRRFTLSTIHHSAVY